MVPIPPAESSDLNAFKTIVRINILYKDKM